jgi:hypothetical protein
LSLRMQCSGAPESGNWLNNYHRIIRCAHPAGAQGAARLFPVRA